MRCGRWATKVVAGVNSIAAYFVVTGGAGWWMVHAGFGPIALVWASGLGMLTAAMLHGLRFWQIARRLRHAALSPPRPLRS